MGIRLICKRKYTEIDNIFIDEYMADAVPVFSLVYIYALRMASENMEVSNSDIAEKLGILESDVVKAWKYWKKVGAVKITGVKTEPVIEFCDIKSRQYKEKKTGEIGTKNVVPAGTKPIYNPSEVSALSNADSKINDLLKMAEFAVGHPLSSNDVSTVVGFYDWLKLPIDVIAVLLTYGSKNSKPMRYIEKIAVDWSEKGVMSTEDAEQQLNFFAKEYKDVLGFFGVHNRIATSEEQRYILKWIKDYNMPLSAIKTACEKTLSNIGQVSFPYASKIIENWNEKGIRTAEDIEREGMGHRENTKSKRLNVKQNSFNGYEQRDYDEDEFDRIVKNKIQ